MKCSVCMAMFNGSKYVEEQVKSIIEQMNVDDELIISDDGSVDDSIKIVNSMNDTRIKVIVNKNEHGYTKNFENSLKHASGDIIFLSDQDDVWLPNKMKIMLEILQNYDYVIHDCMITDSNLVIKKKSYFKEINIKGGFINQMIRMRYLGCCMVFNRKVLDLILPFPPNSSLVEHDTWIASVAELYAKCHILNEPLIYYRRHDNNTSEGGWGKGYPLYLKIYRRLYRLWYLTFISIKKRL